MRDFDYVVGVDLGQSSDYTAIAVVEVVGAREELPEALRLRHLERPELGTKYTAITRRIVAMLDRPPLRRRTALVVDRTGVGAGVCDMLDEALQDFFTSVVLTGGDVEHHDGGVFRVPKRDVVTALQLALQAGRLRIAPDLALGDALVEELQGYEVKIDPRTAHDSYEAGRQSPHDDLVVAVALAVWWAGHGHAHLELFI